MAVNGDVALVGARRARAAAWTQTAVAELLRRAGELGVERGRGHPLAPAALRIERSHVRQQGGHADQTALTVWFGSGPNLPVPSVQRGAARFAGKAAAAVVGAAALGAMAVIASHREAERLPVRRLS